MLVRRTINRHKAGALARGLVVFVLLTFCIGCSEARYRASMTEFQDHPDRWKGQALIAIVTWDGEGLLGEMMRSWRLSGDQYYQSKFTAQTKQGFLPLKLDIPYDLLDSVPNARTIDRMVVRFRCTEGRHGKGNVVESIERYE